MHVKVQTAQDCRQTQAVNISSSLKCSSCGFSVFNRRYPKYERCGALLPQEVAYSSEEVAAVRKREKAQDLARRADAKSPSPSDGDVASWLYLSSSSGSSEGGSRGGGD
ncbi:MAG: hypothetical protein ACK5N7_02345 [Curvibacter sp.]|jgi:hypothetical protein